MLWENKPKMVNAPEGLNQVILRKVRRFRSFVAKKRCQKRCKNYRLLPKNDRICCQKMLPKTIVFWQKTLPKNDCFCQKMIFCQRQSFLPKMFAKFPLNFTRNNCWRACFEMGFLEYMLSSTPQHFHWLLKEVKPFLIGWHKLKKAARPFSCCHLHEKALWQMAKYQENGNRASQSHHLYLQCCLSTSTIMRHLGFLQNDNTIMYSLKSLTSSSRGETSGVKWIMHQRVAIFRTGTSLNCIVRPTLSVAKYWKMLAGKPHY